MNDNSLQIKNNALTQHPFRIIIILGIAIFGAITTEFGLIGSLQLIADNFEVSLSQAGLLLSIYAIIVAVFGPFLTLNFFRYNQKTVLRISIGIFFASTLFSTFATSFILILISRILASIVNAIVWSLALAIAADYFPPEKRAKAVSYLTLGFIFAAYLNTEISWRLGFAFCAFSNFISLIAIVFLLPNLPVKAKITFGNQLNIL